MTAYDVIVVGARCAGSPLAMLLARLGHRVLLVDRATFPSDTVSNGMFNTFGAPYLRRWGLLDRLVAAGVPPVRTVLTSGVWGGAQRTTYPEPTYAPRRRLLDHLLVEAAAEAGAEVREGCRVNGVLAGDDGRVGGVTCGAWAEHARLVVGADGRWSTMAGRFASPVLHSHAQSGGGVLAWFEGVECEGYEFHIPMGGWAGLAPSNDGLTHVGTACDDLSGSPSERFDRVLRMLPEVRDRVRAGTRATRLFAYRDAPVFVRQARGPGWALVGDAGFNQGPISGFGMSHAFRGAERLAGAAHEWLSGDATEDDAMDAYARDRDSWAVAFFEWIVGTQQAWATGRPPPSIADEIARWHALLASG